MYSQIIGKNINLNPKYQKDEMLGQMKKKQANRI